MFVANKANSRIHRPPFPLFGGGHAFALADLFAGGYAGFTAAPFARAQKFTTAAGSTASELGDPIGRIEPLAGTLTLTQTVSASRPTYGQFPKGGVTNLLAVNGVPSEDFSNALWNKDFTGFPVTITANATSAPDGTITADKIVTYNGSTVHLVGVTGIPVSGSTNYNIIYAKADEWTRIGVRFYDLGAVGYSARGTIDLSDGSTLNTLEGSVTAEDAVVDYPALGAGSGWWKVKFYGALVGTSGQYLIDIHNTTLVQEVETGDGVSGIYVWGAQASLSDTPYQKVTSASNITESGVTSVPAVYGDGADDYLTFGVAAFGTATAGLFADTGENWSTWFAYTGFDDAGDLLTQCGATEANRMYQVYLAGGELQVRLRGTDNDTNAVWNDGSPHFGVLTCTNGVATLSLDGATETTLTVGVAAAETDDIAFLARTPTLPAGHLTGFSDAGMIARVLTTAEKANLYNSYNTAWGIA